MIVAVIPPERNGGFGVPLLLLVEIYPPTRDTTAWAKAITSIVGNGIGWAGQGDNVCGARNSRTASVVSLSALWL
jgi:hypothetical protein